MALATTMPGISVTFSPRWWSLISSTRSFVANFCLHLLDDTELADKVGMVAHELLENASKYAVDMDSPIMCQLTVSEEHLIVSVQNRAHPDHVAILQMELEAINAGDPLDAYLHKMEQSLTSPKSQLGLARIRYEGCAHLYMAMHQDLVTVEATFTRPTSKGRAA